MKKLLVLLSVLVWFILLVSVGMAADLVWDAPSDWDNIDGYVAVIDDGSYVYDVYISLNDIQNNGLDVTYPDIVSNFGLVSGVEYLIAILAYNEAGESGFSNVVTYAYIIPDDPPDDPPPDDPPDDPPPPDEEPTKPGKSPPHSNSGKKDKK